MGEGQVLRTNSIVITTIFLYECILTGFVVPLTIVIGSRCSFSIKHLTYHFLLKHVNSTTYYPQGNGQVQSINKVLRTLLTKLVSENETYWDEHLPTILFFYRTRDKITTIYIPYQFIYGLHHLMPIKYILLVISNDHRKGNPMKF